MTLVEVDITDCHRAHDVRAESHTLLLLLTSLGATCRTLHGRVHHCWSSQRSDHLEDDCAVLVLVPLRGLVAATLSVSLAYQLLISFA